MGLLIAIVLALFIILSIFGSVGFGGGLVVLLVLGIMVAAIFYFLVKLEDKKKETRVSTENNASSIITTKLEKLNFNVSKKVDIVIDTYNFKFIAIDEMNSKIVFGDIEKVVVSDFSAILESRISEDGQELITTSRSSQIGRALIGGVLAGGVGAIIGGGGASQKQTTEVKNITLRVVINDISNPYFELNFLEHYYGEYVSKDSFKYREASKSANEWQDIISIIIKQADILDGQKVTNKEVAVASISDELEKLNSLKIRGILNEDEFQMQKNKLLS